MRILHVLVGRLVVVVLGTGMLVPPAQAQTAPLFIREAVDHPGCNIYLRIDGSRLLFRGKPIAAGGNCPPEYLHGTVTRFGLSMYRLQGQGMDCVLTPGGQGRCN